jgi:hypothetical protein
MWYIRDSFPEAQKYVARKKAALAYFVKAYRRVENHKVFAGFVILRTMTMKRTRFLVVTPCSLGRGRRFEGSRRKNKGGYPQKQPASRAPYSSQCLSFITAGLCHPNLQLARRQRVVIR